MVVKISVNMVQDLEEEKKLFLDLALHLASDVFLKHPDEDIRLLVACCLADIFCICGPKAPFSSSKKLKDIFMFITQQLKGLGGTQSAHFNQYVYLLENISWMKAYNICFEFEGSNEIFVQLYKTLFQVINDEHSQLVHMHMVNLMSSIICEGTTVSQELLDTVLVHLLPPHKNLNKQAYHLARALLKKTVTVVKPYLTHMLMPDRVFVGELTEHVFDLILELHSINSHLLLPVLPQLWSKLESTDRGERLQVVRLLANIYGVKDSDLASQNKPLWLSFLRRFNDVFVPIRLECVKFAGSCLVNHPDLAKDLTEHLKVRSRDPEDAVRHGVVVSILTAAKKDLTLVHDYLLSFVGERTLDKTWRVREEAMTGLAQIYHQDALQREVGRESTARTSWITDKLLHMYYQYSVGDRLLVERLFTQYLVPHGLETTERMNRLLELYAQLDQNSVKALNEMWKCQNVLRCRVRDLLDLVNQPKMNTCSKAVISKVTSIARNLPKLGRREHFVKNLVQLLEEENEIRKQLETLVSPSCSCRQAQDCVRDITNKLERSELRRSPFLEMIKFLLERIASVHIDARSISALIERVNKSLEGTVDDDYQGLPAEQAIRAGLELLKVLSFTHPVSFHSVDTVESMLAYLKVGDEMVEEAALQIFRNTGSRVEESFPHISSVLLQVLQHKAIRGPPQQAKYAIHCIHAIFSNRDALFAQIFEALQKGLNLTTPDQLITPLKSFGQLVMLTPHQFASPLKSLVSNFIIKDLLVNERPSGHKTSQLWVKDDEVSSETLAKIQGIKLMVRYLLGVENSQVEWASSSLMMLSSILHGDGDLTEQSMMGNPDVSRLRLAAGSAILRLAQEPRCRATVSLELYQLCALVINDECYEVRQAFAQKLNAGLCRLRLPLDYLAMFALCAKDPLKERQAHARQCLQKNIHLRREYLKQRAVPREGLLHLLPEYVLAYTVHLLAHDPGFTKAHDLQQLKHIKECLWFVLEVLMANKDRKSHAFMWKILENIMQAKDAQAPHDPKINEKLHTVCDLAMNIMVSRIDVCCLESNRKPILPTRYFIQPDKNSSNMKNHLHPYVNLFLTPQKPVLPGDPGAVSDPLPSAGQDLQIRGSHGSRFAPDTTGQAKVSPMVYSSALGHVNNKDMTGGRSSLTLGKKTNRRDNCALLRIGALSPGAANLRAQPDGDHVPTDHQKGDEAKNSSRNRQQDHTQRAVPHTRWSPAVDKRGHREAEHENHCCLDIKPRKRRAQMSEAAVRVEPTVKKRRGRPAESTEQPAKTDGPTSRLSTRR